MKKLLLGLLVFGMLFTSCSTEKERYVRKNAHSVEAQADVKAMNDAFKIMKERGCEDPSSWYYQAAIHWVPTRIYENQLCESYSDWTELKIGWDQCTHSHSGAEEINFLIWHRMYIWHLEKIVRKTSGKEDFALPYWGYTNYDKLDKVMPPMWRDSSGYLYEESRLDSLNQGYPISGGALRMLRSQYPKLMEITDYQTFNQTFDQSIHGGMHNYIGSGNSHSEEHYNKISQKTSKTGMMSDVATAGFDPIFWAHHSNIDRVFQQWLSSPNGQRITLEQLEENPWKYEFFDENGELIYYTPEDVLAVVYNMDYDYDDTKVIENLSASYANVGVKEVLNSENSNIYVIENTQSIGSITKPENYENEKILLEIATTFDNQPDGLYEIYLNHPVGLGYDAQSPTYIGTIGFFGAQHGDPRNKVCLNGCCSPVSEDGKLMTVFNFEVNTTDTFNLTINRISGNNNTGLKVNKISLRNYEL